MWIWCFTRACKCCRLTLFVLSCQEWIEHPKYSKCDQLTCDRNAESVLRRLCSIRLLLPKRTQLVPFLKPQEKHINGKLLKLAANTAIFPLVNPSWLEHCGQLELEGAFLKGPSETSKGWLHPFLLIEKSVGPVLQAFDFRDKQRYVLRRRRTILSLAPMFRFRHGQSALQWWHCQLCTTTSHSGRGKHLQFKLVPSPCCRQMLVCKQVAMASVSFLSSNGVFCRNSQPTVIAYWVS